MIAARHPFLAVTGLALLALDFAALRFQRGDELPWVVAAVLAQGAIYFLAAYWVMSRRPSPLWLIILVAAVLRAPPLLAPPYLSDDVYRYVWDGRVQAAGVNPYRHIPAAPALEPLRDERIYPRINRRTYAATIYPPAAQLAFLATTRVSESVTWMKASMLAWEGLAIGLLLLLLRRAGQPDAFLLLYAWHPLPLWEFAGNGHLDAAAIACALAALLASLRGRRGLAGLALGLATLFKLYPLVLFPALWRRGDRRMPAALAATLCLGYLPYLGVGGGVLGFLPGYIREEGLQSGDRFYLLQVLERLGAHVEPAVYLAAAGLALAGLSAWICFRRQPADGLAGGSLLLGSAAVVAFSPHYAWYVAWLLPLAALTASVPVLLLGVQAFLLYFERGPTKFWMETLIYVPLALFALSRALIVRSSGGSAPRSAEGTDAHRRQPAA
jgi:alpha-1,6-mannosyltransferase